MQQAGFAGSLFHLKRPGYQGVKWMIHCRRIWISSRYSSRYLVEHLVRHTIFRRLFPTAVGWGRGGGGISIWEGRTEKGKGSRGGKGIYIYWRAPIICLSGGIYLSESFGTPHQKKSIENDLIKVRRANEQLQISDWDRSPWCGVWS